jgi:ParB family transcriptional regulator, chromosome partitioning protein
MNLIDLQIEKLNHAPWNPNQLDSAGIARLTESLSRYGLVEPLVVRKRKDNEYEVLSGNQRLKAIASLGYKTVPCVVMDLDDAEAMLLAQILNNLRGQDDQVMKGNLIKTVLSSIPEDKVLSLLPETAESLKSITQFNQEDLAEHLQAWQEAQAARLKHMIIQLTDHQHDLVDDAIKRILPNVKEDNSGSPNSRGTAIFLLCKFYLDHKEQE